MSLSKVLSYGRMSQRALPQVSPGGETTTFARRVGLYGGANPQQWPKKIAKFSKDVVNLLLKFLNLKFYKKLSNQFTTLLEG